MIKTVIEALFALQDTSYKQFSARLIPNIDPHCVIGIRIPALRSFASQISGTPEAALFLSDLPHVYLEENCLHGFLLEKIKDFDDAAAAVSSFLPYVDNWAVCDTLSPGAFGKNTEKLLIVIDEWLASDHAYTKRFALGMMMKYFLDDRFESAILERAASVRHQDYYVRMMCAWFFATALAKQYKDTVPYLEQKILEPWVHNKSIRKAIESRRIPDDIKKYLRTLAVKEK